MAAGRTRIALAIATLTVIWGTTWAVIRIGLEGIPPFTGVAARFAIAFLFLLALIRQRKIPLGKQPHEVKLWFLNGLLAFCLTYGAVYWAEQHITSGLAAVLFATFPLFVAILAHFLLPGEPLSFWKLTGTVLGFAGVAVIFSEDLTLVGGEKAYLAAGLALLAPPACAITSVAIKRWGKAIHPLSISGIPMGITAGVMSAAALAFESDRTVVLNTKSISALLYLAVMGTAVTFSLYYWLLRQVSATGLSLIAYMTPVVAVLVGTQFMDETMTPRTWAGSGLVVAGVALASLAARARKPA
ncbi:MAG: EamA family transporter [Acidobacteria bacterium]|uniref:EamA family transporter n=1 Tax=Candidatus Polarisedimenticola svalbardensis TaxID=2886004 RepID=A0A8J6Y706_9BACT|nr:EamA family transporter [Candidatus Polarisedimenticola svalbardensis]